MFWSKSIFFPLLMSVVNLLWWVDQSSFWLSWDIVYMEVPFNCFFFFDKISMLFALTVSIVSFSVFLYSMMYMNSIFNKKFIITLLFFVISMFLLIFSADLFWLMIGWDGLGISSMFLIFFFQNWKSFNSGMVTFLSNRMGDFCIIMSISTFFFFSNCFLWKESILLSILMIFGAFSKSAQIPFSSWLPLAMAAPTPVSALVHSSTLVTAGIYLLIRFNKFLNEKYAYWTSLVLSLTFLLGGSSSLGEFDLKKIIALSTLSHIGLMMFFIFLGFLEGTLLHLMLHAFFKSLLFMIAGCIIHDNNGEQDIRLISVNNLSLPLNISLMVSIFSMMGIPFLSGFYSKEFFLSKTSLLESGVMITLLLISIFMTCAYSARMLISLFILKKPVMTKPSFNYWMIFFIMSIFSIMSGFVSWILSSLESEETLTNLSKLNLMFFFFSGLMIGMMFFYLNILSYKSYFILNQMWGISKSIFSTQEKTFLFSWKSLNKLDSKGIIDFTPSFLQKTFVFLSMKIIISSLTNSFSYIIISSMTLILTLILIFN